MCTKRVDPLTVTELIGRNKVRFDLPSHFKIHLVVHEIHTKPFIEYPEDISSLIKRTPASVTTIHGDGDVVERILPHLFHREGFQFLTPMSGAPNMMHPGNQRKRSSILMAQLQ